MVPLCRKTEPRVRNKSYISLNSLSLSSARQGCNPLLTPNGRKGEIHGDQAGVRYESFVLRSQITKNLIITSSKIDGLFEQEEY